MTKEFRQYAEELKNKKLFEADEIYQYHLDEYIPIFQNHFKNICETIIKLQRSDNLGGISYLEYTLLYTNLLRKEDTAEVRVYDDNWYFNPGQRAVGNFDFSFLFTKYRELWAELMSSRKRFAKAVTAQETISFLLSCASQFYKYIASAFRFSILSCVETEPFLCVQRADEFEINVGEYMAYTEAIYKENRKRTSKATLDWFSMREEYEYAYEDFTGLDFSGADLSEIDLRYADLRRATLAGTDLQDALLHGARFCQANLRGADLRYCQIHEADFSGADLTNARFTAADAYRGAPDPDKWLNAGYRNANFRNANLTNADFTHSDIYDADFTEAVMNGTMIDHKCLKHFALSEEQKRTIRISK